MKAKLKAAGFSKAHAQLIGIAVVAFVVLVVAKTGVDIKGMFAKADSEKPKVTFESARAEVLADAGATPQVEIDNETIRQLAMLDLSETGEVLGANSDYPNAEEIFTPEVMNKVQIKNSGLSGQEAVQKYAEQVLYVESTVDVLTMLSNMNSDDKTIVAKSQESAKSIIATLAMVPVPKGLEDYHRYKMMYYTTLINIGDVWIGKLPESDLGDQSKILFSLTEKIESIKSSMFEKYKIVL